ncbi:unnamed protein product [Diamesa tonsa]
MATNSLYITLVSAIGFICFALTTSAIGIPYWGSFEDEYGGFGSDRGYFGPWKVCKELTYNREKCGTGISKFRPSKLVFASGICGLVSSALLGIFCILAVIQIAMISSREKVVMKYSVLVVIKLIVSLLAALTTTACATLFAIQTDDKRHNFRVTRGMSFYLEVVAVVLTISLFVMSLYDLMFSRRAGGDPTETPDVTGTRAITYDNPGYREGEQNKGISMTVSSGKPYAGSVGSMNTTLTTMSNGSSVTDSTMTSRGPLRSSLKKPRIKDDFGIQNPGFHGTNQSPHFERKGSVKKVRINTHSTEV